MIKTDVASYEDIAAEYYDPSRHPTCANFREASALLLSRWLQEIPTDSGWFCEVGAGKCLLAELLAAKGQARPHLIIADSSPSMLSYSRQWASAKTHLVLGDSLMLPIASRSLDVLVSSLGDPYNVPSFWSEIYRVLRPGGTAFFNTPSYDWAVSFRGRFKSNDTTAEFELRDGERVDVPSWIYPSSEQIKMIEKSGLLTKEYTKVSISEITATPLSPKLLTERGFDADVVEGYSAVKPK